MKPVNKLEAAAREFHRVNPNVFRLFEKFALQAIAKGYRNFGVAQVWERMRWEVAMTTTGDLYKLNNNHRAYYARWFMIKHPEHEGFFRTRMVKNEGVLT